MKKHYPRLILASLIALFSLENATAQYNSIICDQNTANIEIVQIDTTSTSTLLLCKYTNTTQPNAWINFEDRTYLRDTKNGNEYRLINSINIPLNNEAEPKLHMFSKLGQVHYFALEFEKFPLTTKFDLIESESNADASNIFGISIDTEKTAPLIDVNNFIKQSPIKEYGSYANDGKIIMYYQHKGLSISMCIDYDDNYGRYYQVSLNIENLTGRSVLIDPNAIVARGFKKGKQIELTVVPHADYIKRIDRAQSWDAFFVSASNSSDAEKAGYSASATSAYADKGSVSVGSRGYSSSSYSTAYGESLTETYDGAAAYAAKRDAEARTNEYIQKQYKIRNQISEGYIKTNSIANETQYTGFLNIKYTKVDFIEISIPINGEIYNFNKK